MQKWKIILSALLITAALAGCGANEEQTTAAVSNQTAETTDQTTETTDQTAEVTQEGGDAQQMGDQADLMGKVKSVDGQTITVYKSSMTMGQGGGRPQGDGTGEAPAGDPPAEGTAPADGTGEAPADGERPERPEGGGMNMEDMFTDETVEITVTDATKIVSVTFENEQMVETEVALADLKADDILSVTLKDDTQEAETITIRTGGFGGGRQPQQQQEQETTAAQ